MKPGMVHMALGVFAVAWLMVGLVVRRGGVSVRALLMVVRCGRCPW